MRIAARMAAQRGLGLFRAAEESSRSTVEAGQPPCASACAVEALPSSQTAEQPASREAAVQDEQLPRAVSATGFGGNTRTKKRIFEKRLRVRRVHPWATPPCKRLILGALRGSVGAIDQYFGNGGSSTCIRPRSKIRPYLVQPCDKGVQYKQQGTWFKGAT